MPRTKPLAYAGTTVPVHKSQDAIRKLLIENGAVGFQFTELIAEQMMELKWARAILVDGRHVQQPLRIRIPLKNRRPEQVFRALYYHLKTKFETIKFGIVSFEEEFLPYFEYRLPSGQSVTIAERLLPDIKRGVSPAFDGPMLPAPREE